MDKVGGKILFALKYTLEQYSSLSTNFVVIFNTIQQ